MNTIFVYGTLRRGHGNHRLIKDGEFLGEATIPGKRTGPISVVPSEDHTAKGEVYQIDDETLKRVDLLEGYNPAQPDEEQLGYVRTPVMATLEDGELVEAEVYYVRR